jgi:hypothetical protein
MKANKVVMAMVLAMGGAAAIGCVGSVPSKADPCPCADGYVCCPSNVCAATQAGCDQATQALEQAIAGEWKGYIEGFSLPSGSDVIDIKLAAASDGTLSGQMVMGTASPPPPPTDPDVAWPPGITSANMVGVEGVPYQAFNINWQAPRLQFSISRDAPWQPWCALQTPYPSSNLGYSCISADEVYDAQGQPVRDADGKCELNTTPPTSVDCGKYFPLCQGGRRRSARATPPVAPSASFRTSISTWR